MEGWMDEGEVGGRERKEGCVSVASQTQTQTQTQTHAEAVQRNTDRRTPNESAVGVTVRAVMEKNTNVPSINEHANLRIAAKRVAQD